MRLSSSGRVLPHVSLTALVVGLTAAEALANPATLTDRSARGPVADGTVNASEYSGATSGINNGFGVVIGAGTQHSIDADALGAMTMALTGGTGSCSSADVIVLYVDSRAGGFATTGGFDDAGDLHRAAISGTASGQRATLNFAPTFAADYAIAIGNGFAGLWELGQPAHAFQKTLTIFPVSGGANTCNHELGGLTLTDLGIRPGDSFRYVATLINGTNAFRSNEFHGVAGSTVPGPNPGASTVSLATGDFNAFQSLGLLINEVDADTVGTDALEFVEIYDGGRGNVDLTGISMVLYNGTSDQSYRAIALTGSTTASGYYVVGGNAVPLANQTIGTINQIQNGEDAVALYLAAAATFPNNTPVTATGLVDALVYDTADPDDTGLLAVLTPGQPQIDEGAGTAAETLSMQRCGGGARETAFFVTAAPTTREANDCPACGDGAIEGNEVCDDGDGNDAVGCNNACSACAPNYFGANCVTFCEAAVTCGGNGTCSQAGACDCSDGFYGTDCSMTECGDGFIVGTETCDDGDEVLEDDCPDGPDGTCEAATCGDGFVDEEGAQTEECDGDGAGTGGETADCNDDCTLSICGDGIVNVPAGETCDEGAETDECDDDCSVVECGDDNVNEAAGEECDDGGTTPGDGCDGSCLDEPMGGGGAGAGGGGGDPVGGSGGQGGTGEGGEPAVGGSGEGGEPAVGGSGEGGEPAAGGSAAQGAGGEGDGGRDDGTGGGGSADGSEDEGCSCSSAGSSNVSSTLLVLLAGLVLARLRGGSEKPNRSRR